MFTDNVLVKNKHGLHAMPLTKFITTACHYKSQIIVYKESSKTYVNAKSLLGVLSLKINPNTRIYICANGPDAKEAVKALIKLVNELE